MKKDKKWKVFSIRLDDDDLDRAEKILAFLRAKNIAQVIRGMLVVGEELIKGRENGQKAITVRIHGTDHRLDSGLKQIGLGRVSARHIRERFGEDFDAAGITALLDSGVKYDGETMTLSALARATCIPAKNIVEYCLLNKTNHIPVGRGTAIRKGEYSEGDYPDELSPRIDVSELKCPKMEEELWGHIKAIGEK